MLTKERVHRLRLWVVIVLCAVGLGALIARVYQLQILQAKELSERGTRQHYSLVRLKPERGCIYDRHEAALAVNSSRPCLRLQGDQWQFSPSAIVRLAAILEVEPEVLRDRVHLICERMRESKGRLRSDVLYFNVNERQRSAIEQLNIPGLFFADGTGRVYPAGPLAASTLGFTGLDDNGLEGLERYADPYLRGSVGSVPSVRDGHGINLLWTDLTKLQSTRGADLVLALDQYVQFLAERELKQISEEFSPQWASIVVMEPHRGEVLAVANWPSFDPNHVELSVPAGRKNYAICEAFEPGSTMKTFTLAAALEGDVVSALTPIYCEKGRYRVAGHILRDDVHAYEWLTVEQVLAHSSNIGAVKIAQTMGEQRLYSMLQRLHFGSGTGVSFPGEAPGLLRPLSQWSGLSIAAVPFGQEMQTTVLGLASAYCVIANGGFWVTPKLVLGYRNPPAGEFRAQEYPLPERVLSEKTARTLIEMLVAVTEQGGGKKARVAGFKVAGKTGTAQIYDRELGCFSRTKHVSSFVGFLPAEAPRVVIAVVVNQPRKAKYGNDVAGPAFSRMAAQLMQYLGVFPSEPEARAEVANRLFKPEPDNGSVAVAAVPPLVPETRPLVIGMTMREAYARLCQSDLPAAFQGSGIALLQQPCEARSQAEGAEAVQVRFFPPPRWSEEEFAEKKQSGAKSPKAKGTKT